MGSAALAITVIVALVVRNIGETIDDIGVVGKAGFDGVTAGLRVNASVHAPLLCVANVFKVASGNLSLPGKVDK